MLDDGGASALVQGGRYFPRPTKVRVTGSTFGGSVLKIGCIGLGLFMEMLVGRNLVVTSRVRGINIERAGGDLPDEVDSVDAREESDDEAA
jgi:hypothetical protein